jgi:hypothetical protein
VPIGEEDVDAGEMAIESVEETVELGFDPSGERRMHDDVFVGISQGFADAGSREAKSLSVAWQIIWALA